MSTESSRRELFIDVVVNRLIFERNPNTAFPCFNLIPRKAWDYPEQVDFTVFNYSGPLRPKKNT